MSYRLGDPNPVYVNLLGDDTVAGGSLRFYAKGTTTPKNTYSDEGLSTPNPNPLGLDADGRAANEVWLDGDYTVILYDGPGGTGNVVWTRAVVAPVPPTLWLPDPSELPGGTLKSSGTAYELAEVVELPDPTDSADMMVVVNATGTGFTLQTQPEPYVPPEPEESAAASGYIQFGDVRIAWGTDSAPASGDKSTSKAVTFAAAFDEAPYHIGLTPNLGTITTNGSLVCATYTSPATGGFNANFSLADDDNKSWKKIDVAVPFTWLAIGKKAS